MSMMQKVLNYLYVQFLYDKTDLFCSLSYIWEKK